ncbi:MAG: DUF389 domain-containing protein [Chloroflexota bacterium]|nr:DUF389 domain-containing protein [Chloroflexota bacterium]
MELNTSQTPVIPTSQERKPFRILLPVDRDDEYVPELFRFALTLARALDGEILALHVVTPFSSDEEGYWKVPEEEAPSDIPFQFLDHASETESEGILEVARARKCNLILLHWRGRPHALRHELGHILDPVIEDAPCDVALLQGTLPEDEKAPGARILLATAGGPHAIGAARFAFSLARLCDGAVTLVTVIPEDADAASELAAHQMLDETIEQGGLTAEEAEHLVTTRVIRAADVENAIIAASKHHTMAFLGASNDSVVNQLLLGTVVERLAEAMPVPVVVVKRFRGVTQFWLRRLWRTLDASIPNVSLEDRLDAYKRVRRGARATHDFYILMVLSVVIACMGLLLDSSAVIIGAMLVAPLMTPMLGLGLGVVMGDIRLLKVALRSTLQGVLLAIAVSTLSGWLAPLVVFTREIASRTQPNLLDLTVGLAAGAAGAYSIARQSVAAALPGVAIAAALVPPLAVIGISLSTGRWAAAWGASLLFGTNLVAISFAGGLTYLLLGFVPQDEAERHALLRRGLFVILVLLFLISIPLARTLERSTTQAILDRTLNDVLEQTLNAQPGLSLYSVDWDRDVPVGEALPIRVVVYAATDVTAEMRQEIDETVSDAIGREVRLRLVVIPISELREMDPQVE